MPKKKKNNDAEIVKENYNKNAQLEWERLEGFHFEFEIAKHYLKKYLRGKTVLDIGGGKITLGGQDITDMSLNALNARISFVSQDNFLFNTSIHTTPTGLR